MTIVNKGYMGYFNRPPASNGSQLKGWKSDGVLILERIVVDNWWSKTKPK